MAKIVGFDVQDVRFPTSQHLDGSDAMNPDPDYSAAYLVLRVDDPREPEGHGFCFTIGRGNEVAVTAIESFRGMVLGADVDEICGNLGEFGRSLSRDSQLRWLGPEKGAIHMGAAAVLNAVWDLHAKRLGKPVWQVLAEMTPAELVDLIDFRHISDALTPQEAQQLLQRVESGRRERQDRVTREGYPAYTTSPGWLGYDDAKMQSLVAEAVADGFKGIKLKVGGDMERDANRIALARTIAGPDIALMVDANQTWDVNEAIDWIHGLRDPGLGWVEEPTSPDDVLGHAAIRAAIAPVPVATGEHVQNRIVFKQLFQAEAIDVCQIDTCRLAGVNEIVAVLVLAAKFGVRVCPHTGGVGLCELAQHIAIFDYIAVSGSLQGRMLEYVDHLHEHFEDPVEIEHGRYRVPRRPGYSSQINEGSLRDYAYPNGRIWASEEDDVILAPATEATSQ